MINKHLQEKFKGKSKYKLPFYNKAVQEAPEYLISSFFTCKQEGPRLNFRGCAFQICMGVFCKNTSPNLGGIFKSLEFCSESKVFRYYPFIPTP